MANNKRPEVSPIRRSIGQNLSPLRRVKVVAARDPRLSSTDILYFPHLSQISFQPGNDVQLFSVRFEAVPIVDYPLSRLEPTGIDVYPVRMQKTDVIIQMLEDFTTEASQDVRMISAKEDIVDGPPPLPRSYRSIMDDRGHLTVEPPKLVDMLRPRLEPPLLTDDAAVSTFPEPLRDDQREAVKTYLNRESLLLADDPGMGKTVVVCVALAELFRKGQAQRALIICPEGARRRWAGRLAAWAPALLFTVVRGDRAQRELDWGTQAHVYLTDFQTLAMDVEGGILKGGMLAFDVLVLDSVQAIRFQTREIKSALKCLSAERRWALAGSLPQEPEGWLSVFSILTPDRVGSTAGLTLPDIQKRFLPYVLRRTKIELAEKLPRRMRHEIWLDLDERQAKVYQNAFEDERDRIAKLGRSLSRTHIVAAVARLKRVCNFAPQLLDGVKVQALVDLVEDVSSSGAKIVVFSQYEEDGLDRLRLVLEAYGTLCLLSDKSESKSEEILQAFRKDALWHVLLTEMGARTDGEPLEEATYIAHFDHGWNPAVRRRAEQRLHPSLGPGVPINVYEFWVADTIDEKLYTLLGKRGLLPRQVPSDTQPAELEDRLTIEDWLEEVLEVPVIPGTAPLVTPPIASTVQSLNIDAIQTYLLELSHIELLEGVELLLQELGYPEIEVLGEPDEGGGDLLAWRQEGDDVERVLVRFIRTERNANVSQGRALLVALKTCRDCSGAYLIATTDFTPSCRKLSDESEGRLLLVPGADLYRNFESLGRL